MGTKNSFVPVGPLTDATLYIERYADNQLLRSVQQMEYVILTGPHQQGYTSMIRHLMSTLSKTEWIFVYVDVSILSIQSESTWYRTLSERICKDLKSILPDIPSHVTQDHFEWRDFLSEIAIRACQVDKKIVIVLDELGGAKFDNSSQFFSTLREIYCVRQVTQDSEFLNISFILVGSFDPSELIRDPNVSPYNIATSIEVADFTVDQIQELLRRRGWNKNQATILSERIYYWTDGQPYLTQYLCGHLETKSVPDDVNIEVEKLIRGDVNNLSYIVKGINANKNLKEYFIKISEGRTFPYSPNVDSLQNQLYLLGLIKADANHNCVIRNRIYQKAISKGMVEHPIQNINLLLNILNLIFLNFPKVIGRFILDLFGRDKATDSTCTLLGYLVVIILVLALWGFLDIKSLVNWFSGWWRFFYPF